MSAAFPPAAPASQALPRSFGRYALFDRIGKGGMAEIFLARARTELGGARLVVVKQILPELAANASFAELLVTEAKLAARLSHANVVQVLDLGRADGQLYIAMEYVEGLDLAEILRRCSKMKTPLPVDFALHIVIEMLRGLDYAHRRTDERGKPLGLVHRDVSPSNVLVSFEGEVKLCDFGIAHANEAAGGKADDAIQGKAGYMSPEHARGEPLDARADVFAAGIILWELLSGRRFYRAKAGESLIEIARKAPYADPTERGLPSEERLREIVRRALSPDREARYPSAQALVRELEEYVGRAGLMASAIRLGEWMRETFGTDTVEERRARERAIRAIEAGPLVELEPVGSTAPAHAGEDIDLSSEEAPLANDEWAKTLEMRAPSLEELRGGDDGPATSPKSEPAISRAPGSMRPQDAGPPSSKIPDGTLSLLRPFELTQKAKSKSPTPPPVQTKPVKKGSSVLPIVAVVLGFVLVFLVVYRIFSP